LKDIFKNKSLDTIEYQALSILKRNAKFTRWTPRENSILQELTKYILYLIKERKVEKRNGTILQNNYTFYRKRNIIELANSVENILITI
jgi:hypothetical protein